MCVFTSTFFSLLILFINLSAPAVFFQTASASAHYARRSSLSHSLSLFRPTLTSLSPSPSLTPPPSPFLSVYLSLSLSSFLVLINSLSQSLSLIQYFSRFFLHFSSLSLFPSLSHSCLSLSHSNSL
jgi:hypothetical protein